MFEGCINIRLQINVEVIIFITVLFIEANRTYILDLGFS